MTKAMVTISQLTNVLFRGVGSATQYLGAAGSSAVRKVSPSRLFNKSSEKLHKEGLLETDLDEEVSAGVKKLPSGLSVTNMGGSSPDFKESSSKDTQPPAQEATGEKNGGGSLRRRVSDTFGFLKS